MLTTMPTLRGTQGARALTVAAFLLLLGALATGSSLLHQSRTLEANVSLTADIVDANVRTLTQVQRELLRLETLLLSDTEDADRVELQRAFVTQRMREAVLPYQLPTLGSQALLSRSEALSARWFTSVEPAVLALIGQPAPAPRAARQEVVEDIQELELGFNELVAQGEVNRKLQAGAANDAASRMLASTRVLLIGLILCIIGFLTVSTLAIRGWRRTSERDASTAKRLVAAHRELSNLSKVARATDNLVVITDARGRIEWVNDAFERTSGWTLAEVVTRTPGEVLQGPGTDPATIAEMSQALAAGQGFQVEALNYARDGREYWVAIEVQPVHDELGNLTQFIAVERDITADREGQAELLRARDLAEETAKEKSNFLASMSHEIRTPLNAVLGVTAMLLETELAPPQRSLVELARTRGNLLLELINNTLSFSALEAGEVELESRPVDLRALVQDTLALFEQDARDRGVLLAAAVAPELPSHVRGDETRLRQVLVNLVGNALKFTPTGSVEVVVSAQASVGHGDLTRFEVRDTGIGIPEDRLHRLFAPFAQVDASTTRKYGGSGLGLAICDRLVRAMGGQMDVTSTPGAGTCMRFTVNLPHTTPNVRPSMATTPSTPSEPMSVLLAEDDNVNQIVAVHMLERMGHRVTVVGDGLEALEALEGEAFDVVLMDIHMPNLDGLATTRAIHERMGQDRPPIVAMTANALAGDRERFLDAGMDDYVSKPVDVDALRDALDRVGPAGLVRAGVLLGPDRDTPNEAGPVDVGAFLERHGEESLGLLERLVELFLESTREPLDELAAAIEAGDLEQATSRAHRVRGGAASLCATKAADHAAQIEDGARAGTLDGAQEAMEGLRGQIALLTKWQTQEVRRSP